MNFQTPLSFSSAPILAAIAIFAAAQLHAGVTLDASAKEVKMSEFTQSRGGLRSTQRFYEFKQEKAILSVHIDNKNTEFPVTATLYLFAADASEENIGKWLNNRHNDAIYGDAAEPKSVHKIPAASCMATGKEKVREVESRNGKTFMLYNVTFGIKDVPAFGETTLKAFTDTAKVYLEMPEE